MKTNNTRFVTEPTKQNSLESFKSSSVNKNKSGISGEDYFFNDKIINLHQGATIDAHLVDSISTWLDEHKKIEHIAIGRNFCVTADMSKIVKSLKGCCDIKEMWIASFNACPGLFKHPKKTRKDLANMIVQVIKNSTKLEKLCCSYFAVSVEYVDEIIKPVLETMKRNGKKFVMHDIAENGFAIAGKDALDPSKCHIN